MNNCLVTKLKGTVDNQNLDVMGSFMVYFEASSSNDRTLQITGATKAEIIDSDGDVYFTNLAHTENYGSVVTQELGIQHTNFENLRYDFCVVEPGGACTVRVYGKYDLRTFANNHEFTKVENISYFGANNPNPLRLGLTVDNSSPVDFGNIYKGVNPELLQIEGSSIAGKYNTFKILPYIETHNVIYFFYTNLRLTTEDVNVLVQHPIEKMHIIRVVCPSNFKNFMYGKTTIIEMETDFVFDDSTVFGSIENFVAGQRTSGRTSGNLSWKYAHSLLATFNGTDVRVTTDYIELSWTPTTITWDGVTINA